MDKLLFKRILVTALSVLAIVYVAYLLISANFNMYPTENAVQVTVTDKIFTNAFIIRDETILSNNTSGVLSYSYSDGEQVEAEGEIAKIYENENDALAQTTADALEEKMEALQNLKKNQATSAVGIDTINSSINNILISYITSVNNRDIGTVMNNSGKLVNSINQRQIYTGKNADFDIEIANLQSQIDELRNSSGSSIGSIKTDKAGYFLEYCDGYESSIKYSDIDRLKLGDLKNVKRNNVQSNVAGKIISSLNWYIACEVTADEATSLSLWDSNVTVLFSNAASDSVPASIYRIHQETPDSSALVIFKCDYMDNNLIETRQEPIEIGLGTYTGLRVSKKALYDDIVTNTVYDENDKPHTETKKVQGVYVLYGSEIQFKQVSILYADEDYVICDPSPDEGILFNGETISMYDQVILKGDDLYDGKVIE
ncbi:MAG: HlyD family efflux transporter periplasmic adaptor subunit [Ruminococcus sp.]|nr:HlyD family efflux transporter periplasmic adaptor subunit [Ruminococcus sp.]